MTTICVIVMWLFTQLFSMWATLACLVMQTLSLWCLVHGAAGCNDDHVTRELVTRELMNHMKQQCV